MILLKKIKRWGFCARQVLWGKHRQNHYSLTHLICHGNRHTWYLSKISVKEITFLKTFLLDGQTYICNCWLDPKNKLSTIIFNRCIQVLISKGYIIFKNWVSKFSGHWDLKLQTKKGLTVLYNRIYDSMYLNVYLTEVLINRDIPEIPNPLLDTEKNRMIKRWSSVQISVLRSR